MPNTESIHLSFTPGEADCLAYVLMAALQRVTMTERERTDTAHTAKELFKLLGYSHSTNKYGERIEHG